MSEGLTPSQLAEKNALLVTENAALQQKLDAVLAENAKLMSGFSFFMYSDESGFETYKTETEAIAAANEMIGCCREDAASDGWPEETETIRWGIILQQAVEYDYQKASKENGWMGWCDYKLSPETPATDAILNEVRAQAISNALVSCSACCDTDCVMDALDISYEDAELRSNGAIELHDGLAAIAAQLCATKDGE